jgi:hypothetical protein
VRAHLKHNVTSVKNNRLLAATTADLEKNKIELEIKKGR